MKVLWSSIWIVTLAGVFNLDVAMAGELVNVAIPGRKGEAAVPEVHYRSGRAHDYLWLYHSFGTTARESGCPCLPSCSAYGTQAVAKHGLLGVAMMVDRFLRESGDMGSRRWVATTGQDKLYDPVDDNDYWLHSKAYPACSNSYFVRELVREWTGAVSIKR